MNESYLCLSCWRIAPLLRAYYQCSACRSNPDPFSREHQGPQPISGMKRSRWRKLRRKPPQLRCPWHPEAKYRLYCECGAELTRSMELKNDRPMAVGVAGSRASGKTTLLVTMNDGINRRPDSNVGLLGLGDTEERFLRFTQRLLHERRTLDATSKFDGGSGHYAWEVLVSSRSKRASTAGLLSIWDIAGETWEDLSGEDSEKLNRYLSQLESLALILDGAIVAADLKPEGHEMWIDRESQAQRGACDRKIIRQLIDRLNMKRSRHMRVALVVSKLDLIWDHEAYRSLQPSADSDTVQGSERAQLVRDMLIRTGRKQLIMAAEEYFGEVQEFAVSSFGYRPKHSEAGDLLLENPIRPEGVVDLLFWLLNLKEVR